MFRVDPAVVTLQDMNQWLSGGWGLMQLPGQPDALLTHFDGASPESVSWLANQFTSPTECAQVSLNALTAAIYCSWPQGGAINIPIGNYTIAGILDRIIERQYRRTYLPRFMTLEIPRQWEVMKKHGRECELLDTGSSCVVWGAFFPEYPSVRRALELISDGARISIAISPTIILIGDGRTVLIYDKSKHVGHIENGRAVVTYSDDFISKRITKQLNAKLGVA